jgi:hypothetical protein
MARYVDMCNLHWRILPVGLRKAPSAHTVRVHLVAFRDLSACADL